MLAIAASHHQAGRLAEAERLYLQVLHHNAEQPDALHLLGVLRHQAGQSEQAAPLIERAIAHRPATSSFHLNLGNVLFALGRQPDALASFRRAAGLAPSDPATHYNLGTALVQAGETEAGIAALREAVRLQPEHPLAYYNLGNALREKGQSDEAISAYREAVRLRPDFADALTNLGALLHLAGRPDEARSYFKRALALRPDSPAALANVGEALRASDDREAAASYYERALVGDPTHTVALRGLASIRGDQGRYADAAALFGRLAAVSPDDPTAYDLQVRSLIADKRREEAYAVLTAGLERHPGFRPMIVELVELLQEGRAVQAGPVVRAALLAACNDDTFSPSQLSLPVTRLIGSDPALKALIGLVKSGADPLADGAPRPSVLTEEPVVLAALPRVVFCSPDIERVLTALRRSALLRATAKDVPSLAAQPLPRAFLCALARASFFAEYSWLLEPDEAKRLPALRATVCDALARPDLDPASVEDLLILTAMYEPLGALPGAGRLAAVPEADWSEPFVAVVREQVAERIEEQAIAAALPVLTPIDNRVSVAVRSMYEENPYPRWRAARFVHTESLQARFRLYHPGQEPPAWPSPLPVLIAGAGTGQHPIDTAMVRPDADILAVDLSRASLAYGAQMARRLGVQNVRFAQADILALDALDQRFALIECAGVLHHLENPLAGWRVLCRLLRPDGMMKIGLYSERARAGIVAARTLIARTHVPPTAEGIQLARRLILSLPDQHPASRISNFRDFYSRSGFRDLVMHVQEHRFTIPRLAEVLDELGLRFLGFELRKPLMDRFEARFPDPAAASDLACWDQFEAEEPDTFLSMYQFWCRPR